MDNTKASDFFHKEENFNCAQAVLKYAESHEVVNEELIAEFRNFGGGKAPEGLCGALYAAQHIFNDNKKTGQTKVKFVNEAGSVTCREIRKGKKLSCTGCVDLAGRCLKEYL